MNTIDIANVASDHTIARQISSSRKLLSVKEAATYLGGISTSMLNKLRVYGGGPEYVKIGRRVVYPISALDAFVENGKRHDTSELTQGERRAPETKAGHE
jgi:hypothetical protein